EEGEHHEIWLIGEPPRLEHAKRLPRSESGDSEVDHVDVLCGSEGTGFEPLLEQPPEGLLHVDLQSLRVRVAQDGDTIGAWRLGEGSLAIAETLRVRRYVRLTFLAIPAGGVRSETQSGDGVWLMEWRITESNEPKRDFGDTQPNHQRRRDHG